MSLVITDVSWYSRLTGPTATAGAFGILSLKSSGSPENIFTDPYHVPAGGWVFSSQHFTSGFIVSPGKKLLLAFVPGGAIGNLDMTLYGYLVG